MVSEKALMRRVRQFIPPAAHVVAIEMANANPLDEQYRATPVVLTDYGLLLITATGSTGIVTHVPFNRVTAARSQGKTLIVSFRDESDRPRTLEAEFRRGGERIIEPFLREFREAQPGREGSKEEVAAASYHVAWDHGRGATLEVFENDGKKVVRPTYDPEVAGLQASEMCKQAIMELSRAIADRPELVWVRQKPDWMPEFVWEPPLTPTEPH
jgi:hypothetical protein